MAAHYEVIDRGFRILYTVHVTYKQWFTEGENRFHLAFEPPSFPVHLLFSRR